MSYELSASHHVTASLFLVPTADCRFSESRVPNPESQSSRHRVVFLPRVDCRLCRWPTLPTLPNPESRKKLLAMSYQLSAGCSHHTRIPKEAASYQLSAFSQSPRRFFFPVSIADGRLPIADAARIPRPESRSPIADFADCRRCRYPIPDPRHPIPDTPDPPNSPERPVGLSGGYAV